MTTRRVKRMDELAREIPPARDLWPAISAALQADLSMKAVPGSRRRAGWLPAIGLAASVALVALGVLIGMNVKPQPGPVTGGTTPQPTSPALVPASVRYTEYKNQREKLWTEVEAKLASMSPAEREKVAASLDTLKRSITEIKTALGRDPANALLQELLVNTRQEEMRALTVVRNSGRQEI